jgi:DNA repair protein RadC
LCNAAKLIIAHNHPSGNKSPSEADKKLTKRLKDAAHQMDIELVDHIIIAGKDFTSFANEGLI